LGPKKIVFVSSAPQLRYPDCYGIDMAKIGDFVAFRAAVDLLHENNMEEVLDKVYADCKEQLTKPMEEMGNAVKAIYKPFTAEQISAKIATLIRPEDIKAEVQVIYQSIENLHRAIPGHTGDWYFTGDYPTPGGNRVVNRAFVNYMEGKNVRAY
jgi:amidophosphoribosyltransferase